MSAPAGEPGPGGAKPQGGAPAAGGASAAATGTAPAADATEKAALSGRLAQDDDPNGNIVYDVLHDVSDLEGIGRIKWDIFSVERRLERALREDRLLSANAPALHDELSMSLSSLRANENVAAYKERFVQNEERLKLAELVRFLELAVMVREPLHEAWAKYLAFDYDRLLAELAAVDTEGLAKRPAVLLQGVRELAPRRANAVVAHTERNARQVFKEIPYRDWSRVIAWHEEKNPQIANLIAEARMLYLQAGLARESASVARQMRGMTWVMAAFTAIAAVAAVIVLLRK